MPTKIEVTMARVEATLVGLTEKLDDMDGKLDGLVADMRAQDHWTIKAEGRIADLEKSEASRREHRSKIVLAAVISVVLGVLAFVGRAVVVAL